MRRFFDAADDDEDDDELPPPPQPPLLPGEGIFLKRLCVDVVVAEGRGVVVVVVVGFAGREGEGFAAEDDDGEVGEGGATKS